MTILINKNRKREGEGTIILHDVANATYVVAGNNTVSNLATEDMVVETASITRVWFGAANGAHWTLSRGANVVAVFSGTNDMQFDGAALGKDGAANLEFTIDGGAGFIMTEIKIKQRFED